MGSSGTALGIIGIILAAGAIGFAFIVWNGQNTTNSALDDLTDQFNNMPGPTNMTDEFNNLTDELNNITDEFNNLTGEFNNLTDEFNNLTDEFNNLTTTIVVGVWDSIKRNTNYAPYNLQRRLAEGVWVALVVLALKALDDLPEEKRGRWPWVWALTFPSTLILLVGGIMAIRVPSQPLFRPTAEIAAFQYLAQNAETDAVVLASRETGNPLPAWAPLQVVVGHGPETIHAEELLPRVEAFYQPGTPSEERLALLSEYHVDYVFYGPAERDLGNWNPSQAEYLTPVYQTDGYTIFATEH